MAENVLDLDAARDRTIGLQEAGWRSEERLGKTIWQHPRTGCWYSSEMALQIVRRESEVADAR